MGVIETGRGNATIMNTYMEDKEIIGSQDVKTYRLQMVQDALKYGIKPCDRHYQTTVKTVRKWVKRYQQYKEDGLKDLSRKKTHCPIKIDKETELQIIECRKAHPAWGARRIKEVLELNYSHVSIHRVIKDAGLILPKRKKYKKRKDMQEVRKQKKVFRRFQIDIKYQATHFLIPYRRPTWNSDVESFHSIIEEEFFLSEKPNNETELLAKTFASQIWFNSYRNNRNRNNQNPEQIFPSELNTNKPLPVIPPILVDK